MLNLYDLDKEQQRATNIEEKNVLVVAAPGSGKTTTIINRVNFLCKKNISRDNIIIITFTKAAAINMRDRYKNLYKKNDVPFFGTFHSLFYKILRRAGYNFQIIPSIECSKLIKKVLSKFYDEVSEDKIKEVLNYISIFKTSNMNLWEFKIEDYPIDIFRETYKVYENYKKQKNYYDFDDLQINVYNLFCNNKKLIKNYSKLFKYILVDEFQDCDKLQIEILQLFQQNGSYIFAVGDEDQCIYGFRGSRPDCMVDFNLYFKEGLKLYLCNNYRSPKNIVESSINIINNNKMRNIKYIKAKNNSDGEIKVNIYEDEGEEGKSIGEDILKIVYGENYKYEDNVILYRTNLESRSIIDSFIKRGIPFSLIDRQYNFYEHFICKDILAYLRLSLDCRNRESFIRIINKPFRYISKETLKKLREYNYLEDCFDILTSFEEVKEFQIKKLMELKDEINYLNKISLGSAIDYILYNLSYYKYVEEYCRRYKGKLEDLNEIINEFREAIFSFKNILNLLCHVEKVKEEIENNKRKNNREGVLLSTIHGVKGMEFKNVFLINCNEECIPHSNCLKDDNSIEEERRLFYVGVTRAKENLYLSFLRKLRGKGALPSRFLEEMRLSDMENTAVFKIGDKVIHKSLGEGKVVGLDKNTITILFNDSITRKLDVMVSYSHGLLKKI